MKFALSLTLLGLLAFGQADKLGSYNVELKETSVSGLSAGGFMAVQMHVAFSSFIKGAGVVAGGPYNCAGDKMYTNCMYTSHPSIAAAVQNTHSWSGNKIDDIANMKNQRVYIISGTKDGTVGPSVVEQLYNFYVTEGKFIDAANVEFNRQLVSGHTFPTDFDSAGNNACGNTASPYISNCQFDGAGAILKHIYGNSLNAKSSGSPSGKLLPFSQSEFISSPLTHGMDETGYVYVPDSCASGAACRLHVAFHGCLQSHSNIQLKYVQNTGFLQWADTNNLIVLFPQAHPDNAMHLGGLTGSTGTGGVDLTKLMPTFNMSNPFDLSKLFKLPTFNLTNPFDLSKLMHMPTFDLSKMLDPTAHATLNTQPALSGMPNTNSMLPNPNGCWDWIGWYGADFQSKSGVQMAAMKKMIDRITSGVKH